MSKPLGKIKIAVFISGRGSNLESLIKATHEKDFPAEITVVVSNKPDAQGLKKAEDAGLQTECVDDTVFKSKLVFEEELQNRLHKYQVDLVCLAGFMKILSADFLKNYPDRILNIHPSLLPKYKGLYTHQRALENSDEEAGCTVHYVVPEIDSGRIIVQKKVRIAQDETIESLAEKVLVEEHKAYPEAIRLVCAEKFG